MKNIYKRILVFITTVMLLSFITSCSDEPTGIDTEKNASNIQEYLSKLDYNQDEMLNYQNTGGQESSKDIVQDTSETTVDGNFTTICKTTTYNLKKNFDRVAILRPTTGIVWPGALVKGNESLLDGVPEPIGIERAPITFSINLPGMGSNGIKTVANPAASSVQAAIDSSLEWWNSNAYEEGYVNAANSSFHLSSSFSSKQLALDVDLNAEWASGSVSTQLNHFSSDKKKVVMAVYKQAFYDVIFDTPTSPEKVFGNEASFEKVKSVINNATAPAYIKSVTYGRIIMFRMEATSSYSSTEVEAAFKYSAGFSVDGNLKARYEKILRESTIDLVTIGGNASVATEPISNANTGSASSIIDKIKGVIAGKNAVYSRDNPGVPIAYSVFYLQDNSLAKLGYTTEYTAKECVTTQNSNTISVYFGNFTAIKDCDGIEGAGEFGFRVQILNENNGRIVSDFPSNGKYRGTGLTDKASYFINKTKTFTLPKELGKKFTIKLICYETDKPLIGSAYKDSRMNYANIAGTHSYRTSGSWSGTSPSSRKITINPGTNCSVSLSYSITIK